MERNINNRLIWQEDYLLSRQALNGSCDAMNQLFDTAVSYLNGCIQKFSYFYPTLEDDIQDVIQDALAVCFEKLEQFNGTCRFTTWVYAFVKYKLQNAHKKKKIYIWWENNQIRAGNYTFQNPLNVIISREARNAVRTAMETLNANEYWVIILRRHFLLSYRQIAQEMQLSFQKAKCLLHSAEERFLYHFDQIYGLDDFFANQ